MLHLDSAYIAAKDAEHRVQVLVVITTVRTRYIFGLTTPTDDEIGGFGELAQWDGSVTAGDGGTFGGIPVAYAEGRVIEFGNVTETLAPQISDLITSLTQTEIGAYSVMLDNTDGFFSDLLGDHRDEPLLGQQIAVLQAFEGNTSSAFRQLFSGEITEVHLDEMTLRLVAEAVSTVFPDAGTGIAVEVLALEDDGTGTMASETVAYSVLAGSFLASDDWIFRALVTKDDLADAGVIFEIRDGTYSAIRLQIGFNASNCLYVTTGQNLDGTPTTATYTNTHALTADDLDRPLLVYVRCSTDGGNTLELYWGEAANAETQSGVTLMDRSDTGADNTITFGEGYDGKLRQIVWNDEQYWYVNSDGNDELTAMPDIIVGALPLSLVDGEWVTWP
jgi:hypothetical protein